MTPTTAAFLDVAVLPEGFRYQPEFLSRSEEEDLVARIRELTFGQVRMRGVIARRRVVQFGWHYRFDAPALSRGAEIPDYLLPLRARAAAFAGVTEADLSEVLLTDYPPGAPIGWHRDAPMFGLVVGISLLSACRMRLRKGAGDSRVTTSFVLEPRSAYLLSGPARSEWQHHIPAVDAQRYSVTFRTVRARNNRQ